MKYYSENTVKGLLEQIDSSYIKELEKLPYVELPNNPWHTGTPTEKGTYLVNDGLNDYGISYFDGEKFSYVYFPNKGVIRLWQKIEPYKESK